MVRDLPPDIVVVVERVLFADGKDSIAQTRDRTHELGGFVVPALAVTVLFASFVAIEADDVVAGLVAAVPAQQS